MVPAGPHGDQDEDEGVEGPQSHALRLTTTETTGRRVLDFSGTSQGTKGPTGWPINDPDDGWFANDMVPEAAE